MHKDTKYGIKFIKNRITFEIWSFTYQHIKNMQEALRHLVLLTDFKSEYRILKLIGKGNFAKVYKVKRKNTNLILAAKIFNKDKFLCENKGLEGIYNEVRILRCLGRHNLIMNFHEIHESTKLFIIITEFIHGKQLLKRISNQKILEEKNIKKIMKSLVESLLYIHRKGIMHRDLKPENIMFNSNDDSFTV